MMPSFLDIDSKIANSVRYSCTSIYARLGEEMMNDPEATMSHALDLSKVAIARDKSTQG